MKRSLSVLIALVMALSVLALAPASAAEVPADPNIVDPAGDANQHSSLTGVGGGLSLTGADILAVWFTSDSDNLYTHIQTKTGVRPESLAFITYVDPGAGTDCLQLRMTTEGDLNDPFTSINRTGACGTGTTPTGEYSEEEGPDGTAILTGSFPRADNPEFAAGATLAGPNALVGYNAHDASARVGIIDDTDVGRDFNVASGSGGGPNVEEPKNTDPGKKDEAPVKNGCKKKKGKGKKKGCDKGKGPKEEPKGCDAYVPGESGAGLETLKITDKATAEAPVTVQFDAGVGLGGPVTAGVPPDETTHNYHNIQIDSAAAEAGLYVRLDFSDRRDYDLYLDYPSGQEATHSGDFNGAFGSPVFTCGNATTGCSSGSNFEQVNGIRTADCQGWTTDSVAFLTEGGDVTLSFWLGEIQNDPAPPA